MTVGELIGHLLKQDPKAKVYIQDSCFSPTVVSCIAPVVGYARNTVVDPKGIIILPPVDW